MTGNRTERSGGPGSGATVRHYVPGGCENGGGIGRLVGYIEAAAREAGKRHLVTDTRGHRWSFATSPGFLMHAVLRMSTDRISDPTRIHHIHIAGRGSTLRKLILTRAARALGCPYILHLHDYDYARDLAARSPRMQTLIRQMFNLAGAVVALGQRDRLTLTTRLGVDEARIAVIRNCVPDPGDPNPGAGQTPLIVFLGRLSERKGVPELLRALSHPLMRDLPWRAVLAGDGPLEVYRREVQALSLSGVVDIPGWLNAREARLLCAQADILVLPSHAEGMAMAVIEGLAHGLAVVTTRVGAHEEVISDGVNGVFVPIGDQDALAATLAKLVVDPEARRALSLEARAHYLQNFSMEAYMRSLDNLYETVTAQSFGSVGQR